MIIGTNLNSGEGGGALIHILRAQYHSQIKYRINLILKPIDRATRIMHSLPKKHANQSQQPKPKQNRWMKK